MFFLKKVDPIAVAMKMPRRVLIEKSIEALGKMKFNRPENYSQTLPQNHLWYVTSLNEDIRTAGRAQKIAICLKRNGIKIRHFEGNIKGNSSLYAQYENGEFRFFSPANSCMEENPVKVYENFITGCNQKIALANKSKPFLDQEIGLTAEEMKLIGVGSPEPC